MSDDSSVEITLKPVWSAAARDAAQRVMLRAIYSGLDETDAILAILTPHVEAMLTQARIEGRREAWYQARLKASR